MMLSIIRILIGLLFMFSGILKMTDLISFHDTIELFNILPKQFINAATIFIPSAELICGLSLVLNMFKRGAITILIGLLTVFIIAVGIILLRGEKLYCGCFGPLVILPKISIYMVLFDIIIIFFLFCIYFTKIIEIKLFEQLKLILTLIIMLSFLINIPYINTNKINLLHAKHIKLIDVHTVIEIIDHQNTFIFDARTIHSYNKEHIHGALPLPVFEFDKYFNKHNIGISDISIPVIVYCDNEQCGAAGKIAYKLIKKGFKNVYIILGGIYIWKLQKQRTIS